MSRIFFNGQAGRIEGEYIKSKNKEAPAALVLHHHQELTSNMDHQVICCLCDALIQSGLSILKINFRGVGKSQGSFDNGVGELVDAAEALDWLQKYDANGNYIVVGFSFGAWVGLQLTMRRPDVNHFIALSPPVNKFDFSFLSPCPTSGLIVHGDQDSIVSDKEVKDKLVQRLKNQKNIKITYEVLNGADHFFRNKTDKLFEVVVQYINKLDKDNDFTQQNNTQTKVLLH